MQLEKLIEKTADPVVTSNRLESLLAQQQASQLFDSLSDEQKSILIKLLGVSRFLYHFLLRHSDALSLIGKAFKPEKLQDNCSLDDLRQYKYQSLLQISCMDISNSCSYEIVLQSLSDLADQILQTVNQLVVKQADNFNDELKSDIALMALGKLGAQELNFSSDVDLIFVLRNSEDALRQDMHEHYAQHIQRLCRLLEEKTEHGFLYRVDLNLRPWGRSAPLVFSLDENEEYYQASKETWERIAWLRGRFVAGSETVGNEMLACMQPFVFHKTLSAEDIDRFLKIKTDMAEQRNKAGHWNIKMGEGGIRDIEFFVHIIQMINGAHHPELRITNTLELLKQFVKLGLITSDEQTELKDSYLFLRRLENRLQMIDEQQTHQLPNEKVKLKQIAIMMGYGSESIDEAYSDFNDDLILYQQVARKYFEKLLTDNTNYS